MKLIVINKLLFTAAILISCFSCVTCEKGNQVSQLMEDWSLIDQKSGVSIEARSKAIRARNPTAFITSAQLVFEPVLTDQSNKEGGDIRMQIFLKVMLTDQMAANLLEEFHLKFDNRNIDPKVISPIKNIPDIGSPMFKIIFDITPDMLERTRNIFVGLRENQDLLVDFETIEKINSDMSRFFPGRRDGGAYILQTGLHRVTP